MVRHLVAVAVSAFCGLIAGSILEYYITARPGGLSLWLDWTKPPSSMMGAGLGALVFGGLVAWARFGERGDPPAPPV